MQDIWANSGLGQFGTLPERKPPRVVPARGWVTLSVATPPGRSRADQLESFEVGTRQRIRLTKKKRKPFRIVLTLRHGAFSTRKTHRFQEDRTGQISRVRAFAQPNQTGDNGSLDTVETQTPLRDLLEIGLLMGFHKFCIFIALLGDGPPGGRLFAENGALRGVAILYGYSFIIGSSFGEGKFDTPSHLLKVR